MRDSQYQLLNWQTRECRFQRLTPICYEIYKNFFQDLLVSSGATNFFTLVRYNPPELLQDYLSIKSDKEEAQRNAERKSKNCLEDEDMSSNSFASDSDKTEKLSESAEEIIFMLFGPRVWEHKGYTLYNIEDLVSWITR